MTRRLLPCVIALASTGATAVAHHSLSSAYDVTRSISIEGVVTQFQFINPHPIVIVDVTRNGQTRPWRLEMDNRRELEAIGVTTATFKAGDRIIARGSPGHGDEPRLYIRALDRPADGLRYEQAGFNPTIRYDRRQ